MKKGAFLSLVIALIMMSLLVIYYLVPYNDLEFNLKPMNNNFTLNIGTESVEMQFYDNMRFPNNEISYSIDNKCTLRKKTEMRDTFKIMENLTSLKFYENKDSEINITCDETERFEGGMFIAGEGGPTKIVKAGEFNVILSGTILLIRDSKCPIPNIAIHELLHVLGFVHSTNPDNIMYNFTKCSQQIGQDTTDLINELYSIPSNPDLAFESEGLSALMHGRYLDLNFTVRNIGLKNSPETTIGILANNKEIKEVSLDSLEIGNGRVISLSNVWVTTTPKEVSLKIKSDFEELNKENNIVSFEII